MMQPIIPSVESPHNPITTKPKKGIMVLGHSSDWWNAVLLIGLAIGVVSAFAVAFATTAVIIAQKREAKDAADEFSKYKVDVALRVAEVNERADVANKKALEAELALEQYKAPRSLKGDTARNVSEFLNEFSGLPIDIFVGGTSSDSLPLANDIANTLLASKFDALAWQWTGGPLFSGVVVAPKEGASIKALQAANAILLALTNAGIASTMQTWPASAWEHFGGFLTTPPPFVGDRAEIRIIVGAKP